MKQLSLKNLLYVFLGLLLYACNESNTVITPPGTTPPPSNTPPSSSGWLIPVNEVFDGGPGKDGIPSIDEPNFWSAQEANTFLDANDLVVGVAYEGKAKAYPHSILDWHEIVNDEVNGIPVAVTYCPLTGSASGWNRTLQEGPGAGQVTTFGVSGLLYNTNLIPYDRQTNSNWSQMLLQSVEGPMQGTFIGVAKVIETTWATWQRLYPNTEVLSTNTGFNRDYNRYPYGDYRTNNSRLLFPVSESDNRLPGKDRVLGVISADNSSAQVFTFTSFPSLRVIEEFWQGEDLIVVGSREHNLIAAYYNQLDGGEMLDFSAADESQFPVVMVDSEGNEWDVFGKALAGPRKGQALTATRSYIGYFFAFGAFYPGVEIHL